MPLASREFSLTVPLRKAARILLNLSMVALLVVAVALGLNNFGVAVAIGHDKDGAAFRRRALQIRASITTATLSCLRLIG